MVWSGLHAHEATGVAFMENIQLLLDIRPTYIRTVTVLDASESGAHL